MKDKDTPEKLLQKCANNLIREIAIWKHLQKFGGGMILSGRTDVT